MGSNYGKELKLDLIIGESVLPKTTASDCLAAPESSDDVSLKLSQLNCFLQALEEESAKIQAFKRELPLSMLILSHAIEKLKEEAVELKGKEKDSAMVEEFQTSVKRDPGEEEAGAERSIDDHKKDWMSSVTLWDSPVSECQFPNGKSDGGVWFRPVEFKKEGGAFRPYRKTESKDMEKVLNLPVYEKAGEGSSSSIDVWCRETGIGMNFSTQRRKKRRCWSPELHRRFVDALHRLGGAHAATPKQIIDIMRVDGLTNDEVKSHLQKYRLNVKKLPAWRSSSRLSNLIAAQYHSPDGPLHLSSCAMDISLNLTSIQEEEVCESSCETRTFIG
ncbi:unnamed protein product [Cuscuta epithymum]|uniref:HTH myb-type domain-containing protein n=1 Tax=Cuscuta epithymum TaxID=186058 RepID=A0AAV0EMF5_9ASTE|nr:unnamed protein product [Cuscuta epithymum]